MASGFPVLADSLRRGADNLEGDGNDVAAAGRRAADGATTAAGGSGGGPLADALNTLTAELIRASAAVRDGLHGGADNLRSSANTYARADQGVTGTMDALAP